MLKTIDTNGNLRIQLEGGVTGEDFDFVDYLLQKYGGNDQIQLAEILEYTGWQPNGQLYSVSPEDIAALTEAPIVSDDVTVEDSGAVMVNGKVWWYPDYMIKNFVQELKTSGEVVFTAAPEN